jgi:hypothetical protein
MMFSQLRQTFLAKIGRCPNCWRLSLRWALLGWAATALVYWLGPAFARPLILVWPLAFTLLWLCHMLTVGVRAVIWRRHQMLENLANISVTSVSGRKVALVMSRRRILRIFTFSTASAVLASFALPELANAQSGHCNSDEVQCGPRCCPSGYYLDCVTDDCDSKKNRTCYMNTDENLKYVQQCCSEKYYCG